MLYGLILAIALTCVMCERNDLGVDARTKEDSGQLARLNEDTGPLDHSRRWVKDLLHGLIEIFHKTGKKGWLVKRGSTDGQIERFKVTIQANPCVFNIYDSNGDDAITRDELEAIFGEGEATQKLAEALDKSGDGLVDKEEFKDDMHKYVEGC